jgi:phosphopantetheinyl transferase
LEGDKAHVQPGPYSSDRFLRVWVRKEAIVKAGLASLGLLASIDLVSGGQLVAEWDGLPVTGWEHGDVVGACLSAVAPDLADIDQSRP